MCFCSSPSEDALNLGGDLDLRRGSHLPAFTLRILSTYCVADTKISSSLYSGPVSWGISPSPPLPCSLNPNPRVVMIEDCGKIIFSGGGGGPVFKFWLCSLPAV